MDGFLRDRMDGFFMENVEGGFRESMDGFRSERKDGFFCAAGWDASVWLGGARRDCWVSRSIVRGRKSSWMVEPVECW